MKLAVLSDIHGGYIALQSCMEYAYREQADAFVFLGDYVGELAYPRRTMELLYTLKSNICAILSGEIRRITGLVIMSRSAPEKKEQFFAGKRQILPQECCIMLITS